MVAKLGVRIKKSEDSTEDTRVDVEKRQEDQKNISEKEPLIPGGKSFFIT